ncbi:MAG TPA: dihydropteroate synthase [Bryobacteraceae bacterium]
MNRKIYYWKLREREIHLGERTLIMGVLNITPDSFSDGGRFNDPDRAYARALELDEQGADIIDVGAESTKPGSHRITADEEWQRLVPVLKRLRGNLRAPLSLDTYKSEIAERALEYGVEIFNDPTGLTFDPDMAKAAAKGNAGLILNHMRGQPESWAKLSPMQDPVGTIARELEATINRARHAGVERTRIVVDPGLGFGKRKEQNAEILAHLGQLAALDFPILVGPSRKSFLAQASEKETLYATAAAVAAAVLNGAHIVRVHDVQEMRAVVQVAEEIARAADRKAAANVEERPQARPRSQMRPNFEKERALPRPPRPPIARPAAAAPIVNPPIPDQQAERPIDRPILRAALPETPQESTPESRPPRQPRSEYPDRDKQDRENRGGFRPPSRPFPSRRRDDESGPPRGERRGPPRGRDFRPGQGAGRDAGKPRFDSKGPKKPFVRDGDRPPRPPRDRDDDRARPAGSKPPRFKSSGPKRSFERGGDSRAGRPPGRPERGSGPRSGPPRSGPPRTDRPRSGPSGPPKRPFRKRP